MRSTTQELLKSLSMLACHCVRRSGLVVPLIAVTVSGNTLSDSVLFF